MAINSVVGSGEASKQAIASGLKDLMNEGDQVTLIWDSPTSDTLDALLDVITDREYDFNLLYTEGQNPPKMLRMSSHGICTKTKNPINTALDEVSKDGAVLFLWDDEENDDDDSLIDHVFDRLGENTTVLDLAQGLSPITCEPPVDIPEQEEPAEEEDEDEEPIEEFTRDELASMPAATVKAWAKRKGLESTTKTAIIREAFPEGDDEEEVPEPEDAGNVGSASGTDGEVSKALRQAAAHLLKAANLLQED